MDGLRLFCLWCNFLVFCFVTVAQTDSASTINFNRFISGSISGGNVFQNTTNYSSITNNFRFETTEYHNFSASVGFGKFYQTNKAYYANLTTSVNYFDLTSSKEWFNSFGGLVGKLNVKKLYKNKVFMTLNQQIGYHYTYRRSYQKSSNQTPVTSIINPIFVSHTSFYQLHTGIWLNYTKSFTFALDIPVIDMRIQKNTDYNNGNTSSEKLEFNYKTGFNYSFNTIQLSIIWHPNFLQAHQK